MFAKLAIAALAVASFNVCAESVPLSFDGTLAAKAWFSKIYPSHEIKRYAVKGPGGSSEIYAFYGPRGSGIGRLDVWFYSCLKATSCELLAMTSLGRGEDITKDPTVEWEEPYLVIKSDKRILAKIRR
ncbi:hypothetical protein [Variovorax sp. KBW07]|uniref:hypothetical protein n=1 Tax=Variovorax sp. KBW07 TaxID=2153358 RepID=UPI000F57BF1C|nr:hypothetical protein [Variovorax sp. KBW07]